MTLYDVVKKLVGDIDPVGETNADEKRFENLKDMTQLVDMLVGDIDRVASNKNRVEHSMKRAGQHADNFLTNLGITE